MTSASKMPTSPYASRITGTGSAFPEKIVTNDDLSKFLETNDQWITERTGIRQRRVAERGNSADHNSTLGTLAAKRAMEMAGKTADDIDLILYATCTPDTLIPSTACWVQHKLGAKRAWALDVNAACSGFVFALSSADQFIRSGQYKTALVVGADITSAFVDWTDRTSAILFGDGAGAAIIERTDANNPRRILSTHLGSEGDSWEVFHMPAGGSNMEVTAEAHAAKLDKMQMKGKEIFKSAVRTLADYAVMALEANEVKVDEVDWFIPHQANLRIIEAAAKRLDFPMERVVLNVDRFGNTSSATAITAMDEAIRDGRIKPGQTLLIDVFGAGLTYGSVLLRW